MRVHARANSDEDPEVKRLRAVFAKLIDDVNSMGCSDPEFPRLKALAMTEIESAGMWTIKAATM